MNVIPLSLFLILVPVIQAFSQEGPAPIENANTLQIEASLELKKVPIPIIRDSETTVSLGYFGKTNLGELRPDQRYRLGLSLVNNTDDHLFATEMKAGCGCVELLKARPINIAPNNTVKIRLAFKTPKATENGKFHLQFDMKDEGNSIGTLILQSRLSNNLYIAPALNLEYPDRPTVFRVPVCISAPLSPEKIDVSCCEELSKIRFKLAEKGDKIWLEISVDPDLLDSELTSGTIHLKSPADEFESECRLTFLRIPLMKISPEFLRFREGHSNFEKVWTASALVRFAEASEKVPRPESPRFLTDFIPRIRFSADSGVSVKAEVRKLNDNIFRVILQLDSNQIEKIGNLTEGTILVDYKGETFQQSLSISTEN